MAASTTATGCVFCGADSMGLFRRMREDIEAVRCNDPAAKSTLEIVTCYPGLHALQSGRLDAAFETHKAWMPKAGTGI